MGIDSDSKLFVGAHRSDIKCDSETLYELVDNDEIIRVSPHYDAEDRYCFFGIEVACHEIMAEGGIEKIRGYIAEMNEKFQTNVCDLIHSPHIW